MMRMTCVLILVSVALAVQASAFAQAPEEQRAADLAAPVRIKAGGKPIDVGGFAAPFVGDFNLDGTNDLLVGQLDHGKLRIYLNTGKVELQLDAE